MKTIIYFLLSIFLSTMAYADEFTRSYEFKAIHMERDQFLKAASAIYEYFNKINNMPAKGYVSLGREDYQTEINFPIDQKDYEKFQQVSYDGYVLITAENGVVKRLRFRLSDYSRNVTVTGENQDYISGVINLIIEKFRFYETNFGGGKFRLTLGIGFLILIVIFLSICSYLARQNDVLLVVLSVSSLVLSFAVFFLPPWELFFPGFIAKTENMSFLEKYAATFTFLGFIVTLLVPSFGLLRYFRKRKSLPTPKSV